MSQLANILTILSLFFGFISIILSLSGKLNFAAYSIILSACLDGFDGHVARSRKTSGEFGRELDSLVDVVSFGIAPALLGYIFVYDKIYLFAILVLFIYLVCAVIRLARYNIAPQGTQDVYFHGLPTTVSGGLLASFVLIYNKAGIRTGNISMLFTFLVLLLALLMISSVRYLNLKGLRQALANRLKLMFFSLVLIMLFALYTNKIGTFLFLLILIYLIFSPFVVKRINND